MEQPATALLIAIGVYVAKERQTIQANHEKLLQRNQQMISDNAHRSRPAERKAGRGGAALLSGLVRCRRCGRRMQVGYRSGLQGRQWSYQCFTANYRQGAPRCLHLGGYRVDEQVRTELLRALAPCAIEAALYAAEQQTQDTLEARRAVELELEQAHY